MFSGAPPVHLMWSNMFDPEKPKVKRPVDWKRIGRLFLPYKKQQALVLLCVLLISLLGLLPPIFSMLLIDKAIPSKDFPQVAWIVCAMIFSAIAGSLIGVAQGYFNAVVAEGIIRDLKTTMTSHLHHMPIDFFTNTRIGEVITRVSSDIDSLDDVLSMTLVSITSNLVTIITTVITIFVLDWRLAIVSVMLIPLMVLPLWPVGRRMYEIRKATRKKRDELHSASFETLSLSGILLLKSFVREHSEKERLTTLANDLMKSELQLVMVGRWFMALVAAMVTIGPAIVWLAGGWLAIGHGASIGLIVTFVALLGRLYTPASTLAGIQVQIVSALAIFERIFEYLDMDEEIYSPPSAVELAEVKGKISFEAVNFEYSSGRKALDNVTLTIKPGEIAALVGQSGAGKTTITMLVSRFFSAAEGVVSIDDHDVRSISLESLRKNIGIVTQETYLFHDTILNNLRYAKADSSPEEVKEAAKAARIHDFIESLPEGYDTVVGERGHKLSGGERQRLAIARALLKNPRILVLDEATSSLDSENEALIQEALKDLLKDRTSIVIAHRLSTIVNADQIFVVDKGTIVESGTHSQLIELDGLYARLHKQQFNSENLPDATVLSPHLKSLH